MDNLLQVNDLKTYFETSKGTVKAVDGIDFSVKQGDILAIVGESGCGKSVTSQTIMRLHDNDGSLKCSGEVLFEGQNLLELSEKEMQKIRGNRIAMIFQDPMSSLNPVMTIGNQLIETIRVHQKMSREQAREKALQVLKSMDMPSAEQRMKEYPHQLSGGMKQRIMIAMALCCNPALLIADEPTTALDVTIQAQILRLMKKLQQDYNTAIMIITHDMGVVAEMSVNTLVMYAGKVMEYASTEQLFDKPLHPYTKALLASIPRLDVTVEELNTIKGAVPSPFNMPAGCRFCDRCEEAMPICQEKEPDLFEIGQGRKVRCWKYRQGGERQDG